MHSKWGNGDGRSEFDVKRAGKNEKFIKSSPSDSSHAMTELHAELMTNLKFDKIRDGNWDWRETIWVQIDWINSANCWTN